ncbi:MAG: hypothetical protein DWP97_00070 [Calditrichaeota bacterium]|nr:MAG: hypothetical protein DWP97_00070 [Calditrichota bacterium]
MNDISDNKTGLVAEIEELNDEVKTLAINMAVYLAKAKSSSEKLSQLEPDFIKLVNGTVKVVQELTYLINAAQNKEKMVYDVPSGNLKSDKIELKLESILNQCREIMENLAKKEKIS